MRDRLLIFAVHVATAYIVFIAARIELLNARAGYTLPNDAAMAESRKHGGSGAWRATWMDEPRWRRWYVRDEHCRQCVANGATILKPLEATAWGTMDFYVEDPDGYVICFGGSPSPSLQRRAAQDDKGESAFTAEHVSG